MAIRAIWGFEHLPQVRTLGAQGTGYGLAYCGYPITVHALNLTYCDITIDNGGVSCNNAGPQVAVVKFPVKDLTDGVSPKSFVSFNIVRKVSAEGIEDTVALVALGTAAENVLIYGNDYTAVLNEPMQVELCIDRIKKQIVVYINNKIKRVIKNANIVNNYSTYSLFLGTNGSARSVGSIQFRDFVFIDDTQDDSYCTRLGSTLVSSLPVTAATGAGWTTNAADILTSVTAPLNTVAAMTTPIAVGSDASGDLEYKVSTPNIASNRLNAVAVIPALGKPGGTLVATKSTVKTSKGNSTPPPKPVSNSALNNNVGIAYHTKTSDGIPLTDALVSAGSLTLAVIKP